jgi:hypothetical protein
MRLSGNEGIHEAPTRTRIVACSEADLRKELEAAQKSLQRLQDDYELAKLEGTVEEVAAFTQRFNFAEALIEMLEARIERLERAKPRPYEYDGVRILTEVGNGGFVMPDPDELRRLNRKVLNRYPELRQQRGWNQHQEAADDESFSWFAQGFRSLGLIDRRRDGVVDEARHPTYWMELAGFRHTTTSFIAAAIAHGDIPFTPVDSLFSVSLGLMFGGGGLRATDAWRRVRVGDVPSPVITARERRARETQPNWSPGRLG